MLKESGPVEFYLFANGESVRTVKSFSMDGNRGRQGCRRLERFKVGTRPRAPQVNPGFDKLPISERPGGGKLAAIRSRVRPERS
jgi:hypothetical protein